MVAAPVKTCDLGHLEVQLNLLNWLYSGALIVFDPGHKHFYGHHIRECSLYSFS